jgi:polyphosphate kinase
MPRNFYRRVEVMFPIESSALRKRILTEIIPAYQKDNCRSRILRSDGAYERIVPAKGEPAYRCQEKILETTLADANTRTQFPTNGASGGAIGQLATAEDDR